MATQPRFFQTNKKDLNSEYPHKRKETVKKVIASMTLGKDVSMLFPDVVKNMQTEDVELKKLVYLYLINYAKTQPELVILAVNTFVKDSDDPNPLIRALAIRTMGCLRVEKIFDYLMDPLKKALRDQDPYVRKTGALCVAKLFDLNPATAIENGLITVLQELISDKNPMVIANSVAALAEITEASVQKDVFVINEMIVTKLLAALNECTEWGQTCILTSLATYQPKTTQETQDIVDRVIPRLQHANASVVLAAVKLLMVYVEFGDKECEQLVVRKLAPPLVTLLSSEPEIQYVALRNINLILQKQDQVLRDEVRVFFIKYNDPPYVKLEKLEVIVKLVSEGNVDVVLAELKEYSNEVDIDFVRRVVKAIGRVAIKIPQGSDRCVGVLLELIKLDMDHLTQGVVSVMADVVRRYPDRYEATIPTLCAHLEKIDQVDSKAALVWMIGEYAHRIDNACELLEFLASNFVYESGKVQVQIVTAVVKLFLKKPGEGQALVQKILKEATEVVENPDIRDRAFMYWRLLSKSTDIARQVVLTQKPGMDADGDDLAPVLLDELVKQIGTLASVLHVSPKLISNAGYVDLRMYSEGDEEGVDKSVLIETAKAMGTGSLIENLLDLDFNDTGVNTGATINTGIAAMGNSGVMDLLSMDLEGMESPVAQTPEIFLTPENAQGLSLSGSFTKRNNQLYLDMTFLNQSTSPMSQFAIQFNVNSYGLVPGILQVPELAVGQNVKVQLGLEKGGNVQTMSPVNLLQVAVKNNNGVYYFATQVPVHLVG